jgi:hypothetical protein
VRTLSTNESNSCRSLEVDVDEFTRFGYILRWWRRERSALSHDARLAFEVGNVLRGDCIETINSTSPVQSHDSSNTQVVQTVSKY